MLSFVLLKSNMIVLLLESRLRSVADLKSVGLLHRVLMLLECMVSIRQCLLHALYEYVLVYESSRHGMGYILKFPGK
jgi:hypothetical protein